MQCNTWSSSNLLPTCLWGDCVNGTTCVCHEGFRHDLLLGRYDNCGLPDWAPVVFFSCSVPVVSLAILYGTFVLAKRAQWRSMLWYACLGSTLGSLTFLLSLICLWFSPDGAFSMPWIGALFTIIGSVLSANVAGCVLIGVLSPVAASERLGSIKRYERWFIFGLPGFMLLFMLFSLSFGYGKQEVALGMAFVFLSVALCSSIALPFLYMFPTKLLRALNRSLNGALVQHSQTRVTRIIRKVRAFRASACVCAFAAALICYLASGIHFATGTLPMSWCFYFGFIISLGLFHLQVIHLALPAPEEPSSTSQNKNGEGAGGVAGAASRLGNRLSMMVSSMPQMGSYSEFNDNGGGGGSGSRFSITTPRTPDAGLSSAPSPLMGGNFPRKSVMSLAPTKEEDANHNSANNDNT